MLPVNKKNYRFSVGGLLLLLAAVYSLLQPLLSFFTTLSYMGDYPDLVAMQLTATIMNEVLCVIGYLPVLLMGIMLLRRNHGTAPGVTALISAITLFLYGMINLAILGIANAAGRVSIPLNFLFPIQSVAFVLAAVLAFQVKGHRSGSLAKFWFLPGIVYGIYILALLIQTALGNWNAFGGFAAILTSVFNVLPVQILYALGLLLACRWLAKPWKAGCAPGEPGHIPPVFPR